MAQQSPRTPQVCRQEEEGLEIIEPSHPRPLNDRHDQERGEGRRTKFEYEEMHSPNVIPSKIHEDVVHHVEEYD